MKDSNAPEDKVFDFKFTKGEIAIIKAGLQYFWLDDDFGYALWGTMPYATFGSGDSEYRVRVDETYKKLKQVSKVKPDYGWWGNIKRLKKLCQAEYKKAKKEGEDAEERMEENYLIDTMKMLLKASEKTGNYEWEKMIKEYEQ